MENPKKKTRYVDLIQELSKYGLKQTDEPVSSFEARVPVIVPGSPEQYVPAREKTINDAIRRLPSSIPFEEKVPMLLPEQKQTDRKKRASAPKDAAHAVAQDSVAKRRRTERKRVEEEDSGRNRVVDGRKLEILSRGGIPVEKKTIQQRILEETVELERLEQMIHLNMKAAAGETPQQLMSKRSIPVEKQTIQRQILEETLEQRRLKMEAAADKRTPQRGLDEEKIREIMLLGRRAELMQARRAAADLDIVELQRRRLKAQVAAEEYRTRQLLVSKAGVKPRLEQASLASAMERKRLQQMMINSQVMAEAERAALLRENHGLLFTSKDLLSGLSPIPRTTLPVSPILADACITSRHGRTLPLALPEPLAHMETGPNIATAGDGDGMWV